MHEPKRTTQGSINYFHSAVQKAQLKTRIKLQKQKALSNAAWMLHGGLIDAFIEMYQCTEYFNVPASLSFGPETGKTQSSRMQVQKCNDLVCKSAPFNTEANRAFRTP